MIYHRIRIKQQRFFCIWSKKNLQQNLSSACDQKDLAQYTNSGLMPQHSRPTVNFKRYFSIKISTRWQNTSKNNKFNLPQSNINQQNIWYHELPHKFKPEHNCPAVYFLNLFHPSVWHIMLSNYKHISLVCFKPLSVVSSKGRSFELKQKKL